MGEGEGEGEEKEEEQRGERRGLVEEKNTSLAEEEEEEAGPSGEEGRDTTACDPEPRSCRLTNRMTVLPPSPPSPYPLPRSLLSALIGRSSGGGVAWPCRGVAWAWA